MPTYSAKMQDHDWNDLKYVLAFFRAGTLAGAGRTVGVDETTVLRRLRRLESDLGARLFEKTPNGRYIPTETGRAAIAAAEATERSQAELLAATGKREGQISGTVRVTSVPFIVNRLIAPRLREFRRTCPQVSLELVADARNFSLTRREADVALRLGRPESGGSNILAQKIGSLRYGIYDAADGGAEGWIGYDDVHSDLRQAAWIAARSNNASPAIRVADLETAWEATAAGLGKTLLPNLLASGDRRLRRLIDEKDLPMREIWLLSHRETARLNPVLAFLNWLRAINWA